MDVLECIRTRRSIRKFKKMPVEWYKIGQIATAGIHAPSAGNLQDFRFLAVTKEQIKIQIAEFCMNQSWMADAYVYLVVYSCFTKTKRFYGIRGERLYSIQSSAAAVENMLLAAHSLGLGACWVGAFDEDSVKQALGLPDYYRVQAIIPIGYPDEKPPIPPKYQLEVMLHLNRWGDNSGKVWDIERELLKDWAPTVTDAVIATKNACVKGGSTVGEKIENGLKKLHGHIKKSLKKKSEKKPENNN